MLGRDVGRRLLSLSAALAVVFTTSCGNRGPALYPVRGQVLFQGKPAAGAQVVFHPVSGGGADAIRPSGQVAEDGGFTVKSYPYGDGAPPGEYQVAITWPDTSRQRDGNIPNRLPNKYAVPATSGLQATVNAGPTDLPAFQLK